MSERIKPTYSNFANKYHFLSCGIALELVTLISHVLRNRSLSFAAC